jgi:hypothetical protein
VLDKLAHSLEERNNLILQSKYQPWDEILAIRLFDGPANDCLFSKPRGIAVDKTGAIFVCDSFNHAVRKIFPNGVTKTWAGNGQRGYDDGKGPSARFNFPEGICIDSVGNLFVTEEHRVRKIAVDGTVTTVVGRKSQNAHQDGSKKNLKQQFIFRRKSCSFQFSWWNLRFKKPRNFCCRQKEFLHSCHF